jgi:hypothetical protein
MDNPYVPDFSYSISYPASAHIRIQIIRIRMDIKVLYILKIWIWIRSENYPCHFDFFILNHALLNQALAYIMRLMLS